MYEYIVAYNVFTHSHFVFKQRSSLSEQLSINLLQTTYSDDNFPFAFISEAI